MNEILIADNILSTVEFDVLDLNTRESITTNGAVSRPTIDFMLYPSGLGFEQEISVVEGDTLDYVLNQTIKKKNIKLTILFKGEFAYARYKDFSNRFSRYNDLEKYRIRFSFELNGVRRYVEVSIVALEPQGRDGRFVSANLTLQPLSPFYEDVYSSSIITDSQNGKIYPYKYPYSYGGGSFTDENVIENNFIKDIPLRITLKGPMTTPYASISYATDNEEVGETYGSVRFEASVSLLENESIVIDAFTNRIYKESLGAAGIKIQTDLFDLVDKRYQSFLFAKPGNSKISSPLENNSSVCEVYTVRYVL